MSQAPHSAPIPPSYQHLHAVEYHYASDNFSVVTLAQHLERIQESFRTGRYHNTQLLSLHQTEAAAREDCEWYQARRDVTPLTGEQIARELLRHISLPLPGSLELQAQRDSFAAEPIDR